MLEQLGRIRVRLLIVNLTVLLVPIVGLEFARIYERQLLSSLERDMRNQAALVREAREAQLEDGRGLAHPRVQRVLVAAARQTRTRIRVLDARGRSVMDSHAEGPPEGPEPPPPTILGARKGGSMPAFQNRLRESIVTLVEKYGSRESCF